MERYNYYEAVKEDCRNYLLCDVDEIIQNTGIDNDDDLIDKLVELAWTNDSITGNGSGSYTFNTWKAAENLTHNWDLLQDALEEYGYGTTIDLRNGEEYYDVIIRCYLLSSVIRDLVNEHNYFENDENDEE